MKDVKPRFPPKICEGSIIDVVDPRWNCHGDTFALGDYQINNDQVQKILDDEFTPLGEYPANPRVGDVVVYWEDQQAVHSTQVVQVEPEILTFGKRGWDPLCKETLRPVRGEGAAWGNPSTALLYRRKSQ